MRAFVCPKLVGLLLATGACSTTTTALQPIKKTVSSSIVTETLEGVEVAVVLDEWDGPFRLNRKIFPVRVRVRNRGSSIVRVTYRQFALVDSSKEEPRRLKAISPSRAQYRIRSLGRGWAYSSFAGPGFGCPSWGRWGGGVWGGGCWGGIGPMLTSPMSSNLGQSALPYGDINPGDHVEGWLYFPRLPRSVKTLGFEVQLTTDSGAPLGKVSIPLQVVTRSNKDPA